MDKNASKFSKKKIIVASINKAKVDPVKNCFPDAEVISMKVETGVSSKPIQDAVTLGAFNRVNNVPDLADMVIAVEGGYWVVDGQYYLGDICCIKDENGYRFGRSSLFTISKSMFEYIKHDLSLNVAIKDIIGYTESSKEFKQNSGIIGFLSHGKIMRNFGNEEAVKDCVNSTTHYTCAEDYKPDWQNIYDVRGENFSKLDSYCRNYLNSIDKTHHHEPLLSR